MKNIEKLKSIQSISGLAQILGYKTSALTFLIYKISEDQKYRTFKIPKRSGGERTITAPEKRLKALQRKVADLLSDCLEEIQSDFKKTPAHGFIKAKSIFTNASCHRKRNYVLNVDLEDFFPSIHFGRVKGFFEKDSHFALPPKIAMILAKIVCHEKKLPQGAPSSPVISNLIARILDVQLSKLAKKHRLTYTRYADDLSFSTNLSTFPSAIAEKKDEHIWTAGIELKTAIQKCGFSINSVKTRTAYKSSRQTVTGLVVNEIVTVPSDYRRWARAAVHRLTKTGEFHEQSSKSSVIAATATNGSLNQLEGVLSFIHSAHKFNNDKLRNLKSNADDDGSQKNYNYPLHSDDLVYQKFLLYKNFFAATKPTIVCEGETDGIYIKYAIEFFSSNFPDLIDTGKEKGDADRLLIKIVKHHHTVWHILGLKGGTGLLKDFCKLYIDQAEKFSGSTPKNPVIVILDNDSAGKGVMSYSKGIAKNQKAIQNPAHDFIFCLPNVYFLQIKSTSTSTECVIEDLFSPEILATKLDGKHLSLSNKKNGVRRIQ